MQTNRRGGACKLPAAAVLRLYGFQSLAYEFVHYFSVINPEGWAKLRNKALAFYTGERGMSAAQNVLERYGASYDGAAIGADEFARDFWSGLLSSEDNMRAFLEYLSEDSSTAPAEKRTVLQALRDILDRVIEHLRGLLRSGDATTGAAEGRRLAEQAETAERCRDMVQEFLDELESARQNDTRRTEARRGDVRQNAAERTAASENVRESRNPGDKQRSQYPQAVYNGQNQHSYNTLISLPDIRVTKLVRNNVQGMTTSQIVEAGLDSTDRDPDKKYGWVKQRYTGTDIVVTADSLNHGLVRNVKLNRNGPYVLQIGQILENAIKVNEINPKELNDAIKDTRQEKFRWDRVDHVDVYLGVAQYPNDDPYVIRFLVNVYKDGMHRLDDRDGYIVLKGSLYAHTGAKNDTTDNALGRSGAGTLVRTQNSDVNNGGEKHYSRAEF